VAELILALDLADRGSALAMVDRIPGLRWVKVGSMLMTAEGPALVAELTGRGLRVFLDLKWHDIPHTVRGAVAAAGLAGVVCSPLEVDRIRAGLGVEALIVVPGIRRPDDDTHDQSRTATPGEAVRHGATHLVVGRPILEAADPAAAFRMMVADMV